MSNATGQLDISRLRERAGEKPRTKIGQVRQVWPEVKNLLSAGHSLKDIWTWLNEIGLDIGYAHLSYCVTQLRQQGRAAEAPIQDLLRGLRPLPPEQARQDQPANQAEPSPNEASDPLRNIRERRARKSGFDYDPFPTKGLTE
ncbi:MAG: hypothetical protein JO323_18400 [Acidobacteriia bacterium]|nr:hypothetical protein [Terriglobia bacterium]